MTTRGKVAITAVSVGIVSVIALVGGFFSAPPIALKFHGYRTNVFEETTGVSTDRVSYVSALFCLTNGSAQSIVSRVPSARFRLRLATRTPDGWTEQTRFLCSVDSKQRDLAPSNSVNFSIFLSDFAQPLRASVDFTCPETGNKPWDRVLRWMRRSQTNRSAVIVIQDS